MKFYVLSAFKICLVLYILLNVSLSVILLWKIINKVSREFYKKKKIIIINYKAKVTF
jgi:hypothetical protein